MAIPRAIAPRANRVVLLAMIASMPWTWGPMRHRDCEVVHTSQQKFFLIRSKKQQLLPALPFLDRTWAWLTLPKRRSRDWLKLKNPNAPAVKARLKKARARSAGDD